MLDWTKKRSVFGMSKILVQKFGLEDTERYRNHLRVCEEQFNYLLAEVKPFITKGNFYEKSTSRRSEASDHLAVSSHSRFVFNAAIRVSCAQ
jgi:hypothetical protein